MCCISLVKLPGYIRAGHASTRLPSALLILLLLLLLTLLLLQILAEALQVVRRCKEGQPIQQLWGAAAAAAGEDRTPLAEQQQQQQAE